MRDFGRSGFVNGFFLILILLFLPCTVLAVSYDGLWWQGGEARMLGMGGIDVAVLDTSNLQDGYSHQNVSAYFYRGPVNFLSFSAALAYNGYDISGDLQQVFAGPGMAAVMLSADDFIAVKPFYSFVTPAGNIGSLELQYGRRLSENESIGARFKAYYDIVESGYAYRHIWGVDYTAKKDEDNLLGFGGIAVTRMDSIGIGFKRDPGTYGEHDTSIGRGDSYFYETKNGDDYFGSSESANGLDVSWHISLKDRTGGNFAINLNNDLRTNFLTNSMDILIEDGTLSQYYSNWKWGAGIYTNLSLRWQPLDFLEFTSEKYFDLCIINSYNRYGYEVYMNQMLDTRQYFVLGAAFINDLVRAGIQYDDRQLRADIYPAGVEFTLPFGLLVRAGAGIVFFERIDFASFGIGYVSDSMAVNAALKTDLVNTGKGLTGMLDLSAVF